MQGIRQLINNCLMTRNVCFVQQQTAGNRHLQEERLTRSFRIQMVSLILQLKTSHRVVMHAQDTNLINVLSRINWA